MTLEKDEDPIKENSEEAGTSDYNDNLKSMFDTESDSSTMSDYSGVCFVMFPFFVVKLY